jgi:hypothetical protein
MTFLVKCFLVFLVGHILHKIIFNLKIITYICGFKLT